VKGIAPGRTLCVRGLAKWPKRVLTGGISFREGVGATKQKRNKARGACRQIPECRFKCD